MGSTTQIQQDRTYRPEQAHRYIEERKWSDALKECDGLLNSHNRKYFTSPEVWGMRAIPLLFLGKLDEAERSISEAQALDAGSIYYLRWYLRSKLHYHCVRGEIDELEATLARLIEVEPMGLGAITMLNGRVRYQAGMRAHNTRGRRDSYLAVAATQFKSAESIWNTVESAQDTTRLQNYTLWFLALVNQTHISWNVHDISSLLDNIEMLDAPTAARLRKKLRYRKYFGSRVHA